MPKIIEDPQRETNGATETFNPLADIPWNTDWLFNYLIGILIVAHLQIPI